MYSIPDNENIEQLKLRGAEAEQCRSLVRKMQLDSDYICQWRISEIYKINKNKRLREEYNARKAQLGPNCKENFAFACAGREKVLSIAREGVIVRPSRNALGDTRSGLNLCRYSDVQLKAATECNYSTVYLLVFKVAICKSKRVEAFENNDMPPDPDYDCHVSKDFPCTEEPIADQLRKSQIYLYEFDDNGQPVSRPRQVFPLVVINYEKLRPNPANQITQVPNGPVLNTRACGGFSSRMQSNSARTQSSLVQTQSSSAATQAAPSWVKRTQSGTSPTATVTHSGSSSTTLARSAAPAVTFTQPSAIRTTVSRPAVPTANAQYSTGHASNVAFASVHKQPLMTQSFRAVTPQNASKSTAELVRQLVSVLRPIQPSSPVISSKTGIVSSPTASSLSPNSSSNVVVLPSLNNRNAQTRSVYSQPQTDGQSVHSQIQPFLGQPRQLILQSGSGIQSALIPPHHSIQLPVGTHSITLQNANSCRLGLPIQGQSSLGTHVIIGPFTAQGSNSLAATYVSNQQGINSSMLQSVTESYSNAQSSFIKLERQASEDSSVARQRPITDNIDLTLDDEIDESNVIEIIPLEDCDSPDESEAISPNNAVIVNESLSHSDKASAVNGANEVVSYNDESIMIVDDPTTENVHNNSLQLASTAPQTSTNEVLSSDTTSTSTADASQLSPAAPPVNSHTSSCDSVLQTVAVLQSDLQPTSSLSNDSVSTKASYSNSTTSNTAYPTTTTVIRASTTPSVTESAAVISEIGNSSVSQIDFSSDQRHTGTAAKENPSVEAFCDLTFDLDDVVEELLGRTSKGENASIDDVPHSHTSQHSSATENAQESAHPLRNHSSHDSMTSEKNSTAEEPANSVQSRKDCDTIIVSDSEKNGQGSEKTHPLPEEANNTSKVNKLSDINKSSDCKKSSEQGAAAHHDVVQTLTCNTEDLAKDQPASSPTDASPLTEMSPQNFDEDADSVETDPENLTVEPQVFHVKARERRPNETIYEGTVFKVGNDGSVELVIERYFIRDETKYVISDEEDEEGEAHEASVSAPSNLPDLDEDNTQMSAEQEESAAAEVQEPAETKRQESPAQSAASFPGRPVTPTHPAVPGPGRPVSQALSTTSDPERPVSPAQSAASGLRRPESPGQSTTSASSRPKSPAQSATPISNANKKKKKTAKKCPFLKNSHCGRRKRKSNKTPPARPFTSIPAPTEPMPEPEKRRIQGRRVAVDINKLRQEALAREEQEDEIDLPASENVYSHGDSDKIKVKHALLTKLKTEASTKSPETCELKLKVVDVKSEQQYLVTDVPKVEIDTAEDYAYINYEIEYDTVGESLTKTEDKTTKAVVPKRLKTESPELDVRVRVERLTLKEIKLIQKQLRLEAIFKRKKESPVTTKKKGFARKSTARKTSTDPDALQEDTSEVSEDLQDDRPTSRIASPVPCKVFGEEGIKLAVNSVPQKPESHKESLNEDQNKSREAKGKSKSRLQHKSSDKPNKISSGESQSKAGKVSCKTEKQGRSKKIKSKPIISSSDSDDSATDFYEPEPMDSEKPLIKDMDDFAKEMVPLKPSGQTKTFKPKQIFSSTDDSEDEFIPEKKKPVVKRKYNRTKLMSDDFTTDEDIAAGKAATHKPIRLKIISDQDNHKITSKQIQKMKSDVGLDTKDQAATSVKALLTKSPRKVMTEERSVDEDKATTKAAILSKKVSNEKCKLKLTNRHSISNDEVSNDESVQMTKVKQSFSSTKPSKAYIVETSEGETSVDDKARKKKNSSNHSGKGIKRRISLSSDTGKTSEGEATLKVNNKPREKSPVLGVRSSRKSKEDEKVSKKRKEDIPKIFPTKILSLRPGAKIPVGIKRPSTDETLINKRKKQIIIDSDSNSDLDTPEFTDSEDESSTGKKLSSGSLSRKTGTTKDIEKKPIIKESTKKLDSKPTLKSPHEKSHKKHQHKSSSKLEQFRQTCETQQPQLKLFRPQKQQGISSDVKGAVERLRKQSGGETSKADNKMQKAISAYKNNPTKSQDNKVKGASNRPAFNDSIKRPFNDSSRISNVLQDMMKSEVKELRKSLDEPGATFNRRVSEDSSVTTITSPRSRSTKTSESESEISAGNPVKGNKIAEQVTCTNVTGNVSTKAVVEEEISQADNGEMVEIPSSDDVELEYEDVEISEIPPAEKDVCKSGNAAEEVHPSCSTAVPEIDQDGESMEDLYVKRQKILSSLVQYKEDIYGEDTTCEKDRSSHTSNEKTDTGHSKKRKRMEELFTDSEYFKDKIKQKKHTSTKTNHEELYNGYESAAAAAESTSQPWMSQIEKINQHQTDTSALSDEKYAWAQSIIQMVKSAAVPPEATLPPIPNECSKDAPVPKKSRRLSVEPTEREKPKRKMQTVTLATSEQLQQMQHRQQWGSAGTMATSGAILRLPDWVYEAVPRQRRRPPMYRPRSPEKLNLYLEQEYQDVIERIEDFRSRMAEIKSFQEEKAKETPLESKRAAKKLEDHYARYNNEFEKLAVDRDIIIKELAQCKGEPVVLKFTRMPDDILLQKELKKETTAEGTPLYSLVDIDKNVYRELQTYKLDIICTRAEMERHSDDKEQITSLRNQLKWLMDAREKRLKAVCTCSNMPVAIDDIAGIVRFYGSVLQQVKALEIENAESTERINFLTERIEMLQSMLHCLRKIQTKHEMKARGHDSRSPHSTSVHNSPSAVLIPDSQDKPEVLDVWKRHCAEQSKTIYKEKAEELTKTYSDLHLVWTRTVKLEKRSPVTYSVDYHVDKDPRLAKFMPDVSALPASEKTQVEDDVLHTDEKTTGKDESSDITLHDSVMLPADSNAKNQNMKEGLHENEQTSKQETQSAVQDNTVDSSSMKKVSLEETVNKNITFKLPPHNGDTAVLISDSDKSNLKADVINFMEMQPVEVREKTEIMKTQPFDIEESFVVIDEIYDLDTSQELEDADCEDQVSSQLEKPFVQASEQAKSNNITKKQELLSKETLDKTKKTFHTPDSTDPTKPDNFHADSTHLIVTAKRKDDKTDSSDLTTDLTAADNKNNKTDSICLADNDKKDGDLPESDKAGSTCLTKDNKDCDNNDKKDGDKADSDKAEGTGLTAKDKKNGDKAESDKADSTSLTDTDNINIGKADSASLAVNSKNDDKADTAGETATDKMDGDKADNASFTAKSKNGDKAEVTDLTEKNASLKKEGDKPDNTGLKKDGDKADSTQLKKEDRTILTDDENNSLSVPEKKDEFTAAAQNVIASPSTKNNSVQPAFASKEQANTDQNKADLEKNKLPDKNSSMTKTLAGCNVKSVMPDKGNSGTNISTRKPERADRSSSRSKTSRDRSASSERHRNKNDNRQTYDRNRHSRSSERRSRGRWPRGSYHDRQSAGYDSPNWVRPPWQRHENHSQNEAVYGPHSFSNSDDSGEWEGAWANDDWENEQDWKAVQSNLEHSQYLTQNHYRGHNNPSYNYQQQQWSPTRGRGRYWTGFY